MRDPVEEVRHPHEAKEHFLQYLRNEVFHLNFYRLHMLYFIVVTLIASVIVYGEGLANNPTEIDGGRLRYIDALFLCASAMTTTGLNPVNLGSLTGFQQAVLAVLMLLGNVIFVSFFVVIIRRHFFRKKLAEIVQHSRSAGKIVQDIEQQEQQNRRHRRHDHGQQQDSESSSSINDTPHVRKRTAPASNGHHLRKSRKGLQRLPSPSPPPSPAQSISRQYHYAAGRGAFPWPWESHTLQRLFHAPFERLRHRRQRDQSYLSFSAQYDARGRFRNLDERERAELGGVEYRALSLLLLLLVVYQLVWYALGIVVLVPYAYRPSVRALLQNNQQPGDLSPGWWATFAALTSFTNTGLNVLDANFVPLQRAYLALAVSGALTVAGNTQFPVLLRAGIWALARAAPAASRLRQTCLFLLQHPRRCFLYLFPARETWYLCAIQVAIDLAVWVLFEVLNLGLPAVMAIPPGTRAVDGLFQATGLRNSGAYVVAMTSLAPALLVAFLVTMYISSFPIVMALRQTNTYEERSIGLDRRNASGGGLRLHLRRQLAYDLWFQLLAWFLIAVVERGALVAPASHPAFSLFSLLFEVTSAYGTVGLSTGVPGADYSLSGAFRTGSKLVLVAVMLRGRHRGLPLAIDRSILLPGEELMHRMDAEYDEFGQWSTEEERELRSEEEGGECGRDGDGTEDGGDGGAGEGASSVGRPKRMDWEEEPHFEIT